MSTPSSPTDQCFHRFDGLDPKAFDPRVFDSDWLRRHQLITQENTQGRGVTAHLVFDEQALVLRRYRRGGFIRLLTKDQFVWTGLKRTRPYAEFDLLLELMRLGLPSPRPFACEVSRSGWFYRGALIMHEIPGATTLADTLSRREFTEAEWTALGVCLRRFHDASVYHSDLNANNVLLDNNGDIFLIDFDKSRIRPGHEKNWKVSTLKRLHRSIMKCQVNSETFFFSSANWNTLQDGYHSVDSANQRSSRSA